MKSLQICLSIVSLLSLFTGAVACSKKDNPQASMPQLTGTWIAIDDSNALDNDIKILALKFVKTDDGREEVHFCTPNQRGTSSYSYDGQSLTIESMVYVKDKRMQEIKTVKADVNKKDAKHLLFGKSKFKSFEDGSTKGNSYLNFCQNVEKKTKLKFEPWTCREECGRDMTAFCMPLDKKDWAEYLEITKGLYELSESLKGGEEATFSFGKSNKLEVGFSIISDDIERITIEPTQNIPVTKDDKNGPALVLSDENKRPKVNWSNKLLNKDWGGKIEYVQFLNKNPIFTVGNSCYIIK